MERSSLSAIPHSKIPIRRFRAIARRAAANAYWLSDELEGPGISSVVKTVKMLMKTKKDVLDAKYRAMLYKPIEDRTVQENSKIFRQIGGLKCFKKYPENVKQKLAGCTYYVYYGPNRVLIRQGHEALALYFILSGEVIVSVKTWDPLFSEWNIKDVGTLGEGDMFGEVALLHNIERTATITTITDTELLCIYKKDFNRVLKTTIQKQWDDIKAAMRRFTYFADYNQVAMTEACIISKRKMYNSDQIILGDGFGNPNYSYFVIGGTCQVIEKIEVEVKDRNGIPHYKMYKEPKVKNSADHTAAPNHSTKSISVTKQSESPYDASHGDNKDRKETDESLMRIKFSDDQISSPRKILPTMPPNIETYFIQICLYAELACFGLGENMKNRRIVAQTPVDCLLIPKFWLYQRNEGNIWNRTRNFLDNSMPSNREVFKSFMKRRKWLTYRKKEFDRALFGRGNKRTTSTDIHDVPYSLRTSCADIVFEGQFTYEA